MSWSSAAPGERLGGLLLAVYGLAGRAAMPLLPALMARRSQRGKEDPGRLGERYGRPSLPRPPGPTVWVHAASVGETNAVLPLVERLIDGGLQVVFTTVTVTGASTAAARLPAGAFHQFSPLDVAPWVDRFLSHWRPQLALFVESEFWPATMDRLARAGIPHLIVNGRMSERSFARWRRIGRASRRLFGRVALALCQGKADAERLAALGARRVAVTGNLKFDVPPPAASPAALALLRGELGSRPVWLAASTHEGEEAVAVEVHKSLAARFPDLVTIVAPRHPARGEAVAAAVTAAGVAVARRSLGQPLPPGGGVYLADTMGEMGVLYRVAPVAFVGGSLVPHGGQNPIEPVRLGAAVIHGPHTGNFAEIYAALDTGQGAVAAADATALVQALDRLLGSVERCRQLTGAAEIALAPYGGALRRTMEALGPFLIAAGWDGAATAAQAAQ